VAHRGTRLSEALAPVFHTHTPHSHRHFGQLIDPGSRELPEAFFGKRQSVCALREVAGVDLDGIKLLGALKAGRPEFIFQLLGSEEEAKWLAGSGDARRKRRFDFLKARTELLIGESKVEADAAVRG
jgi:hypothetical protein